MIDNFSVQLTKYSQRRVLYLR